MAGCSTPNSASVVNGSINDAHTPNFTLHVKNLPLDLEKDGVSSIFREYGEVIGVILAKDRNNTRQAYISYSKYSEAELAIEQLNGRLPLKLDIQFKDKSLRNEQKQPELDLSNYVSDFRYKESIMDYLPGASKKAINLGRSNCTPAFCSNVYTSEDELLYPLPTDLTIFNPYDTPGPYHDTNLMYTRGIANVTRDGRRHISYGRGYTYYNLPEPHYKIAAYLENVIERREKGIYEYAPDGVEDETGNCKVCQAPTAFRCQKCAVTFYCSKPCQVDDWAKHKIECQPVPPLIKKRPVNKGTLSNGVSRNETIPKEPEPEVLKSALLRRPKTHLQEQQNQIQQKILQETELQEQQQMQHHTPPYNNRHNRESPKSSVSGGYDKPRCISQTSPARSCRSSSIQNHGSSNENRNDSKKQTTGNFSAVSTSFPTKPHSPQALNQLKASVKTNEENIVFQSHTFLPKDKFVDVIITTTLGNGGYWVQKVSDTEEIENLCVEIQEYVKTTQPIQAEENVKCMVYSNVSDMYFRANIFSIEENVAKVFCHDFGTYEDVKLTQQSVRPIGRFKDLPHFARHIRLVEGADSSLKNIEEMNIISVKAVNVTLDGVIIVEAKMLPKETKEPTVDHAAEMMANCAISVNGMRPPIQETMNEELVLKTLSSIPSVLDTLQVGNSGVIIILAELGQGEYNATIVPNNMFDEFKTLLGELSASCEDFLEESSHFAPREGDLICGKSTQQEWYRGIVMSTKPTVMLALIDEGRIMTPVECAPLPEKFRNIRGMGLICRISPNTPLSKNKFESAVYSVTDISNNSVTVKITCDTIDPVFVGSAQIKKWIPKPEQKGIQEMKLVSGQEVQVMDVFSHNMLYVRSKEAKEVEQTHLLEQEVAKYALNRKPLTEMPVVGQMVLSLYEVDSNYYRAIVTKVEGQKIMVKYIDYGNDEVTELRKLFELPKDLKERPATITKIKLQGIDDNIPLTKEATDYITELIGKQENLICTFSGHSFKDGVILKKANNENVNECLKNYLKPTWEKENKEDRKIYEIEDLPILKLGDVGDEIEAVVLFHYTHDIAVVLGPNDVVAVEAVQVQMQDRITEYVEKTTEHYIPRDKELCIAKYIDCYYRALCLDSSASPTESRVFFIDYGNTELVKHTDIRIFTEDFTHLAPYGELCNIEIPENKRTSKLAERISELAPVNDIITIKIISVSEDSTANIDIPAVRVKLIEEGLL